MCGPWGVIKSVTLGWDRVSWSSKIREYVRPHCPRCSAGHPCTSRLWPENISFATFLRRYNGLEKRALESYTIFFSLIDRIEGFQHQNSVASTLTKYHRELNILHGFHYHSDIVSCIAFHILRYTWFLLYDFLDKVWRHFKHLVFTK